jgi:hypothetical protein
MPSLKPVCTNLQWVETDSKAWKGLPPTISLVFEQEIGFIRSIKFDVNKRTNGLSIDESWAILCEVLFPPTRVPPTCAFFAFVMLSTLYGSEHVMCHLSALTLDHDVNVSFTSSALGGSRRRQTRTLYSGSNASE